MKRKLILVSICAILLMAFSNKILQKQIYDPSLVQTKTLQLKVIGQSNPNVKEDYAILRMSRKDDRVKVRYFAAKSYDGTSVGERFKRWKVNKNTIAISSGTYMDKCEASVARPMGLCIDDGNIVNNKIEKNYGGIIVVYATGGMVASAIERGDINITNSKTHEKLSIDVRNPFQKQKFIDWAKDEKATVFQTHLFIYKDSLRIIENPDERIKNAPRRFLAVCKEGKGTVSHYIINLPTASTLYQGVLKAQDYLKNTEDVSQIVFMINLDTGCQDFYNIYNPNGSLMREKNFSGEKTINQAANLLAYYFE